MANPKSESLSWLILFLWLVIPSAYSSNYSFYGCNHTCGSVNIPFPFGIGRACALNDWFSITCNYSNPLEPPLPYLDKLKLQVRDVSLSTQTLAVVTPVGSHCGQYGSVTWNSTNLNGSPFYYSKNFNKLMLSGCGNALLLGKKQNSILSGCMSTCHESVRNTDVNGCYGIYCCETSIPFYLTEYKLNFTASYSNRSGFPCNFAFLADQKWSRFDYSDPFLRRSSPSIAVALTWTIQSYDRRLSNYCLRVGNTSLQVESDQFVGTLTCLCSRGDDLCSRRIIDPPDKKIRKPVIVGISTSIGVLILVAASFMSYKLIKRVRVRKMKEKFFKRNGGLLLQKQLSIWDSVIEKTTIFTAEALEKATDNFNANRILGRGGQGTVYKGMLTDGRIVAVKRSKLVDDGDEFQIKQFINEVVVLSQVVHKNVVKLLGCCLETEVPLLVYEFIANGTLFDLIHGGGGDDHQTDEEEFLTWNGRLRIATEAAGALAYLHSAVSIPIYHRDIKSTNILLDEKYTAKVSDFGTSRTIAIDRTHITTLVQGTFGYLDPEYFQSSQFTDKSDVYSFGVVLVELLTGQKAISWAGGNRAVDDGEDSRNLSLATRFLVSMEENRVDEILDSQVLCHDRKEDINGVAKLAERCLNLNGKKRPTMKEVAFELERIRVSKLHPPSLASKFQSLECIQEDEEDSLMEEEFSCSIPTSSTGSSSITSGSSSDTSPLLFNTV